MSPASRDGPMECGARYGELGMVLACEQNTEEFLSDESGSFECSGCRCS